MLRLAAVILCMRLCCPLMPGTGEDLGGRYPNVVVFLVDDLGWKDLGCYGSDFYETPNIDLLASSGARFTQAYAACHVCSPSRAAILTGKYPARLKLTDWLPGRQDFPFQRLKNVVTRQALPLAEVTLAEILKSNGYQTGHFGKWHLGEDPNGPLQQGFDVRAPAWNKGWPKSGYHAPFNLDGLSDQPGDYLTDRLTDEAVQFIERNKDRPFFLYLSHFAVHDPIQGKKDLVDKYKRKSVHSEAESAPYGLEGNPDSDRIQDANEIAEATANDPYGGFRLLPNRTVKIKQRQDNPQFAAMVESVDRSLARVVHALNRLGLDGRTILLFTSDNGGMSAANFGNPGRVIHPDDLDKAYSTSNLPLRAGKGWLYDGGIRVPLIIKWSGRFTGGRVLHEPVMGIDLLPTVLEWIGIKPELDWRLDGLSLVSLIEKKAGLARDAIYWHFPHYSNHGMQSPGGAVRSGPYKLLEYFENGGIQLFNLEQDPGERNNLAKSHPDTALALLSKLRNWREDLDAETMQTNPDYSGDSMPSYRPFRSK